MTIVTGLREKITNTFECSSAIDLSIYIGSRLYIALFKLPKLTYHLSGHLESEAVYNHTGLRIQKYNISSLSIPYGTT